MRRAKREARHNMLEKKFLLVSYFFIDTTPRERPFIRNTFTTCSKIKFLLVSYYVSYFFIDTTPRKRPFIQNTFKTHSTTCTKNKFLLVLLPVQM